MPAYFSQLKFSEEIAHSSQASILLHKACSAVLSSTFSPSFSGLGKARLPCCRESMPIEKPAEVN